MNSKPAFALLASPAYTVPRVHPSRVVFEHDSGRTPSVSVIMPLYNYARVVGAALDSLRVQTLKDVELVVVEDCGPDDSLNVAHRWLERHAGCFSRAVLIQHETNGGLPNARNTAVRASRAPFYFPIDADNMIYPQCLERLLGALEESDASFAYSILEIFESDSGVMGTDLWDTDRLALGNYIDAMALVRRDAWDAVGGYSHMAITGWEDYEFWCKLAETGRFGLQYPNLLGRYRVHDASMLRTVTNKRWTELHADMKSRHPWLKLS